LEIRVSRRGIILGIVFGVAATISGIVLIQYTEAFFLVVIFWIIVPVMAVQFIRWVKRKLRS
jgi:lipopolysaccharide export LptBFGC system permease protein LptF